MMGLLPPASLPTRDWSCFSLPVGLGKVRVNQRNIGVGRPVALFALLLNVFYELSFNITLHRLCYLLNLERMKSLYSSPRSEEPIPVGDWSEEPHFLKVWSEAGGNSPISDSSLIPPPNGSGSD